MERILEDGTLARLGRRRPVTKRRRPLSEQLVEKLREAKTEDDCRTIHIELCRHAKGASRRFIRRCRRVMQARIEELRRERLAQRQLRELLDKWTAETWDP